MSNQKYIELSTTMTTDLARQIQARSTGTGEPGEPLFTADTNTLHLAVQVRDSDGMYAANEALDLLFSELEAFGVPEEEINDPFHIQIIDTGLMIRNLAPNLGDDDGFGFGGGFDAPDEPFDGPDALFATDAGLVDSVGGVR